MPTYGKSPYTLECSSNNQESRYFEPRPIQTRTVIFSPTGEISSIDHSCFATHYGGRVSLVSKSQDMQIMKNIQSNNSFVNHKLFTKSQSIEVNEKEG